MLPAEARADGRTDNHLRALSANYGTLNRAHGSVKYSQGSTTVLAAVYGPLPVSQRAEIIDRATVEVTFRSVSGNNSKYDTEKQMSLRQALEDIILTVMYPRTRLSIVLQVLHDDGAILAACINAAGLALVDAGVQCSSMITAVCFALRDSTAGSRLMMDPTREELASSVSGVTIGFTSNSRGVEESGGPAMALCELDGRPVEDELFLECIDVARQANSAVLAFARLSLTRKTAALSRAQ